MRFSLFFTLASLARMQSCECSVMWLVLYSYFYLRLLTQLLIASTVVHITVWDDQSTQIIPFENRNLAKLHQVTHYAQRMLEMKEVWWKSMKHLMLSHTLFTHRIVDTQKSTVQHSNLKEYDQRSTLWIFIQILLRNSVANIHSTYTNKFVTALKNIMQIKGNWRTSF